MLGRWKFVKDVEVYQLYSIEGVFIFDIKSSIVKTLLTREMMIEGGVGAFVDVCGASATVYPAAVSTGFIPQK